MASPYECYVCTLELYEGDMVIPVYRVESAVYVVHLSDNVRHYSHVDCVKG